MLSKIIGMAQQRLSRSPTAVKAALKLRNQCHAIIGGHINGHGSDTGEHKMRAQFAVGMSRFVDVGANVGDWTAGFLGTSPMASGLLLEPSQSSLAALSSRFQNECLTILPVAASDREGEEIFFEEPGAGKTASLVGPTPLSTAQRPVTVSTLDKVLAQHGWDGADFIKIDTEGMDLHVIRGMTGILDRGAAKVVQFEYSHRWREVGSTLGEALHRFTSRGYRVSLLRHDGLHDFDYARFGEFCCFSNFVALKS